MSIRQTLDARLALLWTVAWIGEGTPPRLRRNVWPGAVTVSPRPAPGGLGAPLRTTLFFELDAGTDAAGAPDPIDAATLRVVVVAGREERELLRAGAFTLRATGRLFPAGTSGNPLAPFEPLAVYVVPAEPLAAATTCEVRIDARSASGVLLASDAARWSFTTRAAPDDTPVQLRGDVTRAVHFDHRVFSGTLKPNFDTSALFEQVPTYELLRAVAGPPPSPAAGPLQRDWPLCGDYFTNAFFDGDPNLVRERETRRITRIVVVDAGGGPGRELPELELAVADLPERELYGIEPDRPLAPDYPVGCAVLLADDERSESGRIVAVDESRRTVRVRAQAADLHVFEPPPTSPDSPSTPGHFPQKLTRLVKLDPPGTPVYWFGRLDHEWDLVHSRFGRRLVVGFDRTPCDLSASGVPNRVEGPKSWREWHDVARAITSHLIERYGRDCLDFYWSVFNEPDLRPIFWAKDDVLLLRFYDVTVDAILRAFEEHELPSDQVKVGGLELGALAPQPELLVKFLEHCSPRGPERNAVANEPASQRVRALVSNNDGRGSPCDFVSLHEYKHAGFAIEQLKWARRTALSIDPDFFERLAVVSFETDPDWNPTRDPATRAMFLGNGFWPAWAADWTRRAIAAAFADPAFARHEALLTVWPLDRNLSGIPTLSTLLDERRADGLTRRVTIPKDVLHFLACLGWMGTDYFLLEPAAARRDGADAPAEAAGGPELFGFGSHAGDELSLLIGAHAPLDPENRDAHLRRVELSLDHVPFERGVLDCYALDADHATIWPLVRDRLFDPPRHSFTPAEIEALQRAARFEPIERNRPLEFRDGALHLTLDLPPNGLRFFRIRRNGS